MKQQKLTRKKLYQDAAAHLIATKDYPYWLREKLTQWHGAIVIELNDQLLVSQKIDQETTYQLLALHWVRGEIITSMKALAHSELNPCRTNNAEALRRRAEKITEIDYALQETWGFPQNVNRHRFWDLPGCRCDKDRNNAEYLYSPKPEHWTSDMCPIHGPITEFRMWWQTFTNMA